MPRDLVRLAKIISGGQTGVDRGALDAAVDAGLDHGGWCPPGRSCEDGRIPARYFLMETPDDRSPDALEVPRSQRTQWNVRDADGLLVFRPVEMKQQDAGTDWAIQCAQRAFKPCLVCDPHNGQCVEQATEWLKAWSIRILNVAGPSENTWPGIRETTYRRLMELFQNLMRE